MTTPPITIQDTVMYADGSLASGSIVVTWPQFVWAGISIFGGQSVVEIAPDGTVTMPCYPTSGSGVQPQQGVYYTAAYRLDRGPVYREYWAVPPSPPVTTIGAIRTIPEMPQNQ